MSNHLTSEQRYEIYLGIKRFWSKSRIAREINVHPSTVIREIRRNSNASGEYVWLNAQRKCDGRRHGLKGNHRKPPELWWRIEQMILTEDWSPSQIAGVLRKEGIHIVKQTIYNHVHADSTGKLRPHMPHELKYTRRCKAIRPTKATNIADRVSIHQRPAEADGTRLGDWEMDTIVGFIRTCYSNAHRTFHKLHTHGETRTGTQGLANGPGRVQAAIPIQRIIEDHHHRQRVRIRSTP